ncbi:MAG: cytochrome P450 [Polyangiales bacterium]
MTETARVGAKGLPGVRGRPFFGSALEFGKDPFAFFHAKYQTHGPVVRVRLLSIEPVMLLGPEANQPMRERERSHMSARPAFERLGRAHFNAWSGVAALDANARLKRLVELAGRLVAAARAGALQSFVDLVLRAAGEGLLDEDDLLVSLLSPYFAGIDTVAGTLASGVCALLGHEDVIGELREELDLLGPGELSDHRVLRRQLKLRAFVNETLRRYPVSILTLRQSIADIDFSGHRVPPGTMLGFCTAFPHFMPEHFPEPDEFCLGRWLGGRPCPPNVFQPFGAGPHTCLGASLAETQLLTTLAILVREYEPVLSRPGYVLKQKLDPLPRPYGMSVTLRRRARSR